MIKELFLSVALSTCIGFSSIVPNQTLDHVEENTQYVSRANHTNPNDFTFPSVLDNPANEYLDYVDNNLSISYRITFNNSYKSAFSHYSQLLSSTEYTLSVDNAVSSAQNFLDLALTESSTETLTYGTKTYTMGYVYDINFSDNGARLGVWLGLDANVDNAILIFHKLNNNSDFLYQYFSQYIFQFIMRSFFVVSSTYSSYLNYAVGVNYTNSGNMFYEFPLIEDYTFISMRMINTSNENIFIDEVTGYGDGYSTGYAVGYNDGVEVGTTSGSNLANLFLTIADIPLYIIHSMTNFELFGVTLFVAIMSFFTLAIVIWIVKKVT